jgi:hypothetical protein
VKVLASGSGQQARNFAETKRRASRKCPTYTSLCLAENIGHFFAEFTAVPSGIQIEKAAINL